MLLVLDNYDSFTYNLVQYLGELGADPVVYRNNTITINQIKKLKPKHIVISPGPGRPENAGISIDLIKNFYTATPILGVCLGHQAIGYAFGGKIDYAPYLMHGKTSQIYHNGKHIFSNITNPFEATRYHSLVIEKSSMPPDLEIIAWTDDNIVMGVKHKKHPLFGIQFHPESILTSQGKNILKNFLMVRV